MRKLTSAGQERIKELAQRHGFSTNAVMSMLDSVMRGNGNMAQFDHPEFGGAGQWMQGGMTMVSDMFNHSLKGRVDALCSELSRLTASQPDFFRSSSFQSQTQGSPQQKIYTNGQSQQQCSGNAGTRQKQTSAGPAGPVSLFVPAAATSRGWWPADLGQPDSTGAQNGVRYAYFGQAKRLAIELNGEVTLYDTLDNHITSFSQQQPHGASLTFASQHGLVAVASLPVVPIGGAVQPVLPLKQEEHVSTQSVAREADVFATIEKLAKLHSKGILSDEEFATKKAELLRRV